MEQRYDIERGPRNSLSAAEAEELFSKVDNSGHANEELAERQRMRRQETGHGVEVDPLSEDDPSGSNVGALIRRAGVLLMAFVVGSIIFIQIYVIQARSANTQNLSSNVSVLTVAAALDGGLEWGGGFTQFPQDFSVQEADENTGRIEVSVVDTTSSNALLCFSNSQIQATAFSINSLLNPRIDTVIYHVNVHMSEDGQIQKSSLFGFMRPTGELSPFITFIWTKNTSRDGQVHFNCMISGVDADLQETLRKQIMRNLGEDDEQDANSRTVTHG